MVGIDIETITLTGITPKLSGMASVQRHPTMPMTKRDSLVITGSRLSLISTSSNTNPNPTKAEDKDTVNTYTDMVAGKRRSPKKVKRTDSYKKALNRQSQYDNVDGLPELPVVVNSDIAKRREDRQKYNTLPINTGNMTCNGDMKQRKKRPSGNSDDGAFLRNASQKSGTYPSPDTDEDQRYIQPERKKKSAFKRFKERFISTIRRDSHSEKSSKRKQERGSQNGVKRASRVRPNHTQSAAGFHTPSENSAKQQTLQNGHHGDIVDGGVQTLKAIEIHEYQYTEDNADGKKKGGLLTVIRRSFRRKHSPPDFRGSKKESPDSQASSNEFKSSPKDSNSSRQSHTPKTSSPIAIPSRPKTPEHIEEEDIFDADDTITAIFGSIIDQRNPSHAGPLGRQQEKRGARADRTKLRLDGLRTCRPKSFDKPDGRGYGYQSGELSPTVDIDGLDYADGPAAQLNRTSQVKEEEDLSFFDVSQDEKQRRIDEVARCLAALGDRIAAEKELESAGSSSEVEGHRIGPLSSLERSLIRDLRHYADTEFNFGQQGVSVATNLMPAVKNIIAAQDYSNFKLVVQQELSNTNGWDQVAWYTYLIKTAVCLAETNVGSEVKKRAKKYFHSYIKPWIISRPNGWDSIHEETDIDSELD